MNKLVELPIIPQTKTERFLLPSISLIPTQLSSIRIDGVKRDATDILKYYGIRGVFLEVKDHYEKYPYGIVLLFNPSLKGLRNWHFFYDFYKGHKNYIKDWDLDLGVVCIAFDMEAKYRPIRELFINGKFSKFPTSYTREFFIRHDGIRSIHTHSYQICNKSESYREFLEEKTGEYISPYWEYEEVPHISKEILDYTEIKKNIKEKI